MSLFAKDFEDINRAKSYRYVGINDLYEISRKKKNEWGIDSYSVPKTIQYPNRSLKFTKEKRANAMSLAKKRSGEPDPCKYSPDSKSMSKMYWEKGSGRFLKGKKNTIFDHVLCRICIPFFMTDV